MPATLAAPTALNERFTAEFPRSRRCYEQACAVFPNGVTHDVRYLEPFPIYIDRAQGSHKWDIDGHELIDYWAGHGALLLGHCHPDIVEAVQRQVGRSTHPGACHEAEVEWGQWVQRLVPSAQKVRFVSSGTEATLMALRLARLFTGKPRVLKFVGHFHGWHDAVMPSAYAPYDGAPVPGIPSAVQQLTVAIPPNDLDAVDRTLAGDPAIGCVILEPTGGHWGAVPIRGAFLQGLRELTRRHGRLLIFDEVITGFRVAPGGAQQHYGIVPDLTTLAKVLAGGLPGGCVAGRADIMALLEIRPGQPKIKHPGTFNANPLSAAAGVATLKLVATGVPCQRANDLGLLMRRRLNQLFERRGVDWLAYGEFSGFRLLTGYRGPRPQDDGFVPYYGALDRLDSPVPPRLHHAFRAAMLLHGIDLWGLSGMLTAAHSEADVDATVAALDGALDLLRQEGLV